MATQIEMLEYWDLGCKAMDNKEYPTSLQYFDNIIEDSITPPASIYFNKSIVHFILGQFAEAITDMDMGLKKNEHMAIGYFQRGIVYIKMHQIDEAIKDFDRTMDKMRGNLFIDYKQLGMNFKLSQIEIKINRAYCINEQGRGRQALSELQNAAELNIPVKNKVIEGRVERFKTTGKVALLLLPTEALSFKPPQSKIKDKDVKKYLKKGEVYVKGEDRYELEPSNAIADSPRSQSLPKVRPAKPTSPAPSFIEQRGANRRPPPPTKKPQLPQQKPARPPPPPIRKQDSRVSYLIVKVHYTFSIALYIDPQTAILETFKEEVANKFNIKPHSISLWYKPGTELVCIFDEPTLKHALTRLRDGYRVTMWAYDEKGIEGKDCIALYDFNPLEEGDLAFRAGDVISIKSEINNNWLEGKLGEDTGLIPRSYVKID